MAIKLTYLVARVPPDVEKRVRRIRDVTRSVLQDALRAKRPFAATRKNPGLVNSE